MSYSMSFRPASSFGSIDMTERNLDEDFPPPPLAPGVDAELDFGVGIERAGAAAGREGGGIENDGDCF